MSRQDVLVTADWAEKNLGTEGIVFLEVDEDTAAYDGGHLPGAVKINWTTELQDQVRRDIVDADQFAALLSAKGVGNDDTVVLYGGNNNWFAAYAYWQFKLYGHGDVKLLDGGRKKWELASKRSAGCRGRHDEIEDLALARRQLAEQPFRLRRLLAITKRSSGSKRDGR